MSFKLETERLLLRTLRLEDIDEVMEFWGNEEVMEYCYGAGNRERVARSINHYAQNHDKKGFSVYLVIAKETGHPIGACGYNPTRNTDEIELIYHYKKESWGKGYATEAAKACIKYVDENLININKITASVDPRHAVSIKVLEKLGFKYTHSEYCDMTKQNEPYYELLLER